MDADNDIQQLRMLSIAHYVMAAMTALFSCFPIIHVTIGLLIFLHPPQNRPNELPFPAEFFGLIFAGLGSLIIIVGWTFAICILIAGRSLEQRRRYAFCMVIAAINCMFPPMATALGVFTLIVLARPSVHALFLSPESLNNHSSDVPFAEADDRETTT